QNASGLGNAHAGSAATAENASTIWFNPAGMTQLQAREFSVGLSLVKPSFKFENQGSLSGALAGNGGDAGSWAALPNAYLSWALSKDLYVGVGLGAPFGLKTSYDDNWIGAAQSLEFDIKTYNINPSIAYRLNDKVSLGLGVNWQRMDATYKRAVSIVNLPLSRTLAILDADSDAWGWNAGALFTLSDATRLGVSYRSAVKHELRGSLNVEGPAAGLNPALANGSAGADVKLPDTLILSAAHRLDSRWELLGDLSWTGWSKIDQLGIVRTSGALSGVTVQTLDAQFRDTWRLALGANYQYNPTWKFKGGIAYDQTPVRGADRRLTALPDNNRTWLTVGAQWKPTPASALDFGVAYLFVPDTSIDNNQLSADPAQNRGRVTGEYKSSVWILGAQYSMSF
ncbi:MAG: OmpP1/FadL family transporter, partial [Gammaproteobacteria bacterium]